MMMMMMMKRKKKYVLFLYGYLFTRIPNNLFNLLPK